MATRQEVFDRAYIGLASQGFERSYEGVSCLYRGPHGRRCAIGWNISDERYGTDLEGLCADDEPVLRAAGINRRSAGFAALLQASHDRADSPSHMRDLLEDVAERYHLTIPKVSEASS